MNQQAERFLRISLVFHPVDSIIGNQIRDISVFLDGIIILCNKGRIIVIPLSGYYLPVIKSGWQTFQMPFADQRSLITYLLQQLRECLLRTVEYASRIIVEFIGTAMLTRNHTGTAGTA